MRSTDVLLLKHALAKNTRSRYRLDVAKSLRKADEALVQLQGRQQAYDLIFLDLSLPDAHDLEAVRTLVAKNLGIPIIVMTGNNEQATAFHALNECVLVYLVK